MRMNPCARDIGCVVEVGETCTGVFVSVVSLIVVFGLSVTDC